MAAVPRQRLPAKAARRRAARAELLMQLARSADAWAKQLRNQDPHAIPFEQWPEDDPLRQMARDYALTAEDLAKLADTLGEQLEDRAVRACYGELMPVTDD